MGGSDDNNDCYGRFAAEERTRRSHGPVEPSAYDDDCYWRLEEEEEDRWKPEPEPGPPVIGPVARRIIEAMATVAGATGLTVSQETKRHAPDAETAIRYALEDEGAWIWIEGPGRRDRLPAVQFIWSLKNQDQIFDYHTESKVMENIIAQESQWPVVQILADARREGR